MEGVDAWVGLSLRTAGGALLLQVIEFDDAARAAARMDQTRGGQGFTPMTSGNVIGDGSLLSESGGSAGLGVLFVKGRRFVSLQAVGQRRTQRRLSIRRNSSRSRGWWRAGCDFGGLFTWPAGSVPTRT